MFGIWDWAVVAAYVAGTTLIGHRLKGRQKSTRDFFLGGRNMPWYAVAASSIATTISAITFIGVPALVYAVDGNFVYLQRRRPPQFHDEDAITITAAPGDTLFFGPYTAQASFENTSGAYRRVLINGYAYPGANSRVYPGSNAGRTVSVS